MDWNEVQALGAVGALFCTIFGGAAWLVFDLIRKSEARMETQAKVNAETCDRGIADLKNDVFSLRSEIGDLHARVNDTQSHFVSEREFTTYVTGARADMQEVKNMIRDLSSDIRQFLGKAAR